jgi:hypothetical protein
VSGTRRVAEGSFKSDGSLATRCSAIGEFVDEIGTNISISSLYSWVPKWERSHYSGGHATEDETRLLCCSSMTLDGIDVSLVEGDTIMSAVSETHVQQILVLTLRDD